MASVSNSSYLNNTGYQDNHTLGGVACNNDKSHLMVAAFQRYVTTEVNQVSANSNVMTRSGAAVNGGVAGVEWFSYTISSSSVSIVGNTPAYKLLAMGAIALFNVNQTTPVVGTPVTAGGYGTTASASYTGTSGNLLLVAINVRVTSTMTALNCTQELNFQHTDPNLGQCFVGYVVATGAPQTIGATLAANDNWELSIIEIEKDDGLHSDTIAISENVTVLFDEGLTLDVIAITETVSVERTGGTSLNISVTPIDNFQSRILVELGRFRTWAGPTARLWLGEFGIPNNKGGTEQPNWNRVLEIIVDKCICDNIAFSYWATGHSWGSYNLEPYTGATTTPGTTWSNNAISTTFDSVVTRATPYIPFVGVNYAGHEFGISEQAPTSAPAQSDFAFLLGRGTKVIRYPLGEPIWTNEWVYIPETNSWRGTNIQHIENVLNRAALENVQIILDILHPGGGSKYATIGGAAISNATNYNYYIAYATKLLNHSFTDHLGNTILLKNHAALYGIDIANEPQTLGAGSGNQWLSISQTIVNDFRNASKINYQGTLFVGLPHYSGVQDILNNAPSGPWITDPSNNFWYSGHYYPEVDHTGTFSASYQNGIDGSGSFSGQGTFTCTAAGTASSNNFSESVTITESVTIQITRNLSVIDTISITEVITSTLPTIDKTVSIAEIFTLSDVPSVVIFIDQFNASVSDQINIQEDINRGDTGINAQDSITISESVSINVGWAVSVSDSLSITENISILMVNLDVSVFDLISISEIATPNPDERLINLYEFFILNEFVDLQTTIEINIVDTLSVEESNEGAIVTTVSVFDVVSLVDSSAGFQFKPTTQLQSNRARGMTTSLNMKRAGR